MKSQPSFQPPRWADRLLETVCAPHLLEEVQGDLHERYGRDVQRLGKAKADQRYITSMLSFIRPFALKRQPDAYPKPFFSDMLRNFITIARRNLWRNRTSTTIGVVGLSIGLASGLLIFLLVSYLFSFDRYHAKADRIYWIVTDVQHEQMTPSDATPRPLGEVLRREYPFVESAARIETLFQTILSVPDGKGGFVRKFEESRNVCFTEPQFFSVFDVEWAKGTSQTALTRPNSVVLSELYAEKYFGNSDPVGRVLRFNNETDLTVTGVIKNPPSNTKLHYDVLISYGVLPELAQDARAAEQWNNLSTLCFVALREGTPVDKLVSSFPAITRKYLSAGSAKSFVFRALPLSDLNHNPQYGGRAPRPILYALILVGIFLVVAACINFINVATAQALKRSKEVGVRKVAGSTRGQLMGQFMTETALVTLAAVALALLLTGSLLPMLNKALAMLHADLSILDVFQPRSLVWFGSLILGVMLLAGLYPSLVLARFNPVAALRGRLTTQQVGGVRVRRGLVVFQFFITQLFVIAALVMTAQVRHMRQADLGFNKESILMVPVPTNNGLKQQTLRERLQQIPGVQQVALGAEPPAYFQRLPVPFTYDTHTEPEKFATSIKIGDAGYIPLFGLKLVAGRNFRTNDSTSAEALVSETTVRQLGLRSPDEVLGKRLRIWDTDKTIVGVVGDFYGSELRKGLLPIIMLNMQTENNMAALKVAPANLPATMQAVEQAWNSLFPDQVFKADFVDDMIGQLYLTERILLGLIQAFSGVAILIGCLGLYGLVSFMAEAKTKEIGVRKVLGAGLGQLLWLFGREFGTLILLGFALAAPLGWWVMSHWLRGYAYRIELGWWVFALTLIMTVMITVVTIFYESIKAALVNPVKSLRSE